MATQSCQVCFYFKPEPNAQSTINLTNIENLLTTTPFHFMVTIERNMWNEGWERGGEKRKNSHCGLILAKEKPPTSMGQIVKFSAPHRLG
jgi:hypothetical protein